MSPKTWLVCVGWLLFGCACGEANKPQGVPLHVTGSGPAGVISDGKAALRVSFDRPVVAESEIGKPLKEVPLTLVPAWPLSAHWADRQTLVFVPTTPWQRATRYQASLAGTLGARVAGGLSFSFVHDPLDFSGLTGVDTAWTDPEPHFNLTFDQAVSTRAVVEHCSLAASSSQKVALRGADPEAVGNRVQVTTEGKLDQGSTYALRCPGLTADGGNEPLADGELATLAVYPRPALLKTSPKQGERATPDELTITLAFATPVSHDELEKHLHLAPAHGAFPRDFVQQDATEYQITLTLEAATTYTLQVDASLKDRFGQKLGRAHKLSFSTSDAGPSISVQTGIHALEASASGYPLWSRNVDALALSCAQVPLARIAQVLGANLSFAPWYAEESAANVDWKALGLSPKRHSLEPATSRNKWQKTELDLKTRCGTGERGVYLAEVRSKAVEERVRSLGRGTFPYRMLVNVTDLGLMLKVGPASGLVWVTTLSSAEPVAGAQVSVFDLRGKKVYAGTTDASGLLALPGSDKLLPKEKSLDPYEDYGAYRDQRLIAVAERGADLAVVDGQWSDGIEAWSFGFETDRSGGERRIRGSLHTDRGVYRPGETVHLKGLAREVALTGAPRVPREKSVAVRVEDGQGTEVYTGNLRLSTYGGFHFDLPLETEARTGEYYVNATLAGQTFHNSFLVEEVRPVTFEIRALEVPRHVALHERFRLSLEAQYLFGAPVAEASVNYEIQRRSRWVTFAAFSEFEFVDHSSDDGYWPWWSPESEYGFVADGTATTDARGRFRIAVRDTEKTVQGAFDYVIRTRVRDAADQEVTKSVVVSAHPADFYLGIRPDSWVASAGEPFALHAVAVDPQGAQLATNATLTVERVDWHCGYGEGPYGYWSCTTKTTPVSTQDLAVPAQGEALSTQTLKASGSYRFRIAAKDGKGRAVSASTSVWVSGGGESAWFEDAAERMTLIASKKKYAPGETARLLPQADTRSALLLVTLERSGVLESRLVRATDASTPIEVPILAEHGPNLYVSVAMLQPRRGPTDREGPRFKLGMSNLAVETAQHALRVTVATHREDYEPGQRVEGTLRVVDASGAPVQAEVAVSVADEGILQLIGYQTPNPMSAIYAPWGLGVQSASSVSRVARLEGGPGGEDGEEGADAASGREDRTRERFVSSAYWNPALVTDAQGEAHFAFEAPDNLTAFRVMAVAADTGSRFGSGEQRIRVRREMMAMPIVPRFVTAGDDIELGAVVHNYTGQAGEAQVRFTAKGAMPASHTVTVTVPALGKAVARYPVKIDAGSVLSFGARVALGAHRDALALELPVLRPRTTDYRALATGRGNAAHATVHWPSGIDEKESGIEISLDRVGLADLGPSLRYLIRYPYGCLEQTLSGLVPLLKVKDLARSLDLAELRGGKLEEFVALGIAKVLRHQHADGHFSLWPDAQTYPHLTVYALWGLNEAKRAGVQVKSQPIERGVQALEAWASAPERTFGPSDETASLAMAAFVLADLGHPNDALVARLFAARAALPAWGKAFLLRAMLRGRAKQEDVLTVSQDLLTHVKLNGERAEVIDSVARDPHYLSSAVRSHAMTLSALLELSPRPDVVAPLVASLRELRAGGMWPNTQDNLYSLVALADYARGDASGRTDVTIRLGDRELFHSTLVGGAAVKLRLPPGDVPEGSVLAIAAEQPVYYSVLEEDVRFGSAAQAQSAGFEVLREYRDPKTASPVTSVKVGDLVQVVLTVNHPTDAFYVAVSDPLPAGFEVVNTQLAQGTESEPAWSPDYNYRSLRDSRADFFSDRLSADTHHYEYLLRATHVGRFSVSGARVEQMYKPSSMGRSAATVLTVSR